MSLKRPRPLAELCHDALAEGVIATHDGLPPSWLELFQKNEQVMAQLQALVLDVRMRESVLRKDTLVTLSVQYPLHPFSKDAWQVGAGDLGTWQFALLEAYFQGLAFHVEEEGVQAQIDLDRSPLAGYNVNWHGDDLMAMWEDLVRWHCPNDKYTTMYTSLTHTLLHEWRIDVEEAYSDDIERWQATVGNSDFFEGWSGDAIADFFPQRTEKLLRDRLHEEVTTKGRVRSWMWQMERTKPNLFAVRVLDRAYHRASFCTVHVNLRAY